jgi:ppGpp synthetase/RelA/SpoT-type nucleotidyltranferase
VEQFGKLVEVQIRTSLQHNWAEFSEKLADEFGHAIKYGGGNEEISSSLAKLSTAIFGVEEGADADEYDKVVIHAKSFIQEMNQLLNVVKAKGKT